MGGGLWRSLVARLVRDEEAAGSNPVSPTHRIAGPAQQVRRSASPARGGDDSDTGRDPDRRFRPRRARGAGVRATPPRRVRRDRVGDQDLHRGPAAPPGRRRRGRDGRPGQRPPRRGSGPGAHAAPPRRAHLRAPAAATGRPRWRRDPYARIDEAAFAHLVQALPDHVRSTPGAAEEYSNFGYAVLGAALAAAAGEPWFEAVRSRVVEPLDLPDAVLLAHDVPAPRRLVALDRLGRPRATWTLGPFAPAGGCGPPRGRSASSHGRSCSGRVGHPSARLAAHRRRRLAQRRHPRLGRVRGRLAVDRALDRLPRSPSPGARDRRDGPAALGEERA